MSGCTKRARKEKGITPKGELIDEVITPSTQLFIIYEEAKQKSEALFC